ncbi:unnamed protein product [Mycena citricolor]|uniref:DUF6533 domain-containing protein n=1 Tax=Mycena citricolor TaxID=2018698 RepID=A0AAD2HY44_9AGAR|nr:unnamed protein product [Mycena citricolor]
MIIFPPDELHEIPRCALGYNWGASSGEFLPPLLPSMSTALEVSEAELVATILLLRYISVFSLAVLLYDHILTFSEEVRSIWQNRITSWPSKAAFWVNRYMTEVVMISSISVFSGDSGSRLNDTVSHRALDDGPRPDTISATQRCQSFLWFFGATMMIFAIASHAVIIIRMHSLWDDRRIVALLLVGTFFVFISTTAATGINCVLILQETFKASPIFKMCLLTSSTRWLPATFGIQSGLDIVIMVFMVYSALERPHRTNSEVIVSLQTDGVRYLVVLFILRTLYLVSSLAWNPGQCVATVLACWSLNSVITTRLHMRLDALQLPGEGDQNGLLLDDIVSPNTPANSSWWGV